MSTSVWTSQTSAANNSWNSVTYADGLFVAVSPNGVMTSSNSTNWILQTSPTNSWSSVTYGNNIFLAVSNIPTNNQFMRSHDGITWTSYASGAGNIWTSVAYGLGIFVAVASSGLERVMISTNGMGWNYQSSPKEWIDNNLITNDWTSVTFGNSLFVAVAKSGNGNNRVMTSPDGIIWTIRTSAANNDWTSVTYGNGIYVAVSDTGIGNRAMTSPDGITWTIGTSAADNNWASVTYGNGLFVAVSFSDINKGVMTSPDGITWTIGTSAADNNWTSITYGQSNGSGIFVAVANTGDNNRVMTANKIQQPIIGPLSIPFKMYNGQTYQITQPSSDSSGGFSYTSSNLSVATITNGNTLTASGTGETTITATQSANGDYTSGSVFALSTACFPAGTLITCDQGEIAIDQIDTKIHTIRGKKIMAITKTVSTDKYLVQFEKGALGNNLPSRDTKISKNHEILYNGQMIKAQYFVKQFEKVTKVKYNKEILYNILLENHDKMIVNNIICETLNPTHDIAKITMFLKNVSPEEQRQFIKNYNIKYTENKSSKKKIN